MKLPRRQFLHLAAGAAALPAVSQVAWAQAASAPATLSPTGKLRVALIASNPVLVTRGADGSLGGVSVAVARTLAARLGVPIELKPYDNPARYNESLATDDWDIGLAARDPARAEHLAFSVTFMEVDNGYVARAGAAPTTAEEVDRAGVKIAVAQGSAPHTVLHASSRMQRSYRCPAGSSRRARRWQQARPTFTVRTCTSPTASLTPYLAHACCPDVSTSCKWRSECASGPPRRFPPSTNS